MSQASKAEARRATLQYDKNLDTTSGTASISTSKQGEHGLSRSVHIVDTINSHTTKDTAIPVITSSLPYLPSVWCSHSILVIY